MKVASDSVIELDFAAHLLPEDEEVASTRERGALLICLGRFELAPGVERALLGMSAGEEKTVEIGPEEGYGPIRPENIHRRRRSDFPPDVVLEPGMRFAARLKDSEGRVEFGVREVSGDDVVIDFNHPFAGRRLRYSLLVRSVRQPTAEEREETRQIAARRTAAVQEAEKESRTPPAAPAPPAPPAAEVSIEDVMRLGLRVARIREASRVEGADRLLRLSVDIGEETRTIVAGIAAKYAPDSLVGRSIILVANLKPARIRGVESRGMLLAAVGEDGLPIIATFDEAVPAGAPVR
jgi:methionine--tRNA ligase beta chain